MHIEGNAERVTGPIEDIYDGENEGDDEGVREVPFMSTRQGLVRKRPARHLYSGAHHEVMRGRSVCSSEGERLEGASGLAVLWSLASTGGCMRSDVGWKRQRDGQLRKWDGGGEMFHRECKEMGTNAQIMEQQEHRAKERMWTD